MQNLTKFIFILAIFPIFAAVADDLPDLGSSSAAIITPAKEKLLGMQFMQEVRSQISILDDPLINDYVATLGYKLASNSDAKQSDFHFFVVDDSDINAFSGPAGYVAVNSGIFSLTQNESELASVMAHEIGHVVQHHIARTIARQKELAIPNMAALLATMALGVVSPDAAIGAMGAISAGNMSSSLSFSRANEQEADRVGMQILASAGFDPNAMPTFLKKMQRYAMDYGDKVPTYLRTHPQTAARIADTENRAKQYPHKNHYQNSDMFYLMKARVYVITAPNSAAALNYFQHSMQTKTTKDSPFIKYGYALALDRSNQLTAAANTMTELAVQYPNQPIYQMGLAEINVDANNSQQALIELDKIIDLYPDYYPLVVQYAATLIACNQNQQAVNFIKKEQLQFEDDAGLFKLLSKAEGQRGNLGAAYYARAKYFELIDEKQMAIIQLRQALTLPNLSFDDRTAINAELASLQPAKK
jgi:beta-barrel assembly-enhancing protease